MFVAAHRLVRHMTARGYIVLAPKQTDAEGLMDDLQKKFRAKVSARPRNSG